MQSAILGMGQPAPSRWQYSAPCRGRGMAAGPVSLLWVTIVLLCVAPAGTIRARRCRRLHPLPATPRSGAKGLAWRTSHFPAPR